MEPHNIDWYGGVWRVRISGEEFNLAALNEAQLLRVCKRNWNNEPGATRIFDMSNDEMKQHLHDHNMPAFPLNHLDQAGLRRNMVKLHIHIHHWENHICNCADASGAPPNRNKKPEPKKRKTSGGSKKPPPRGTNKPPRGGRVLAEDEEAPSPPHRRKKPRGGIALREIRQYQKSTDLLLAKLPFQRLVREITQDLTGQDFLWQTEAIVALQEASEDMLIWRLEHANYCAIHAKRVTIMERDMKPTKRILKIDSPKKPDNNPNV